MKKVRARKSWDSSLAAWITIFAGVIHSECYNPHDHLSKVDLQSFITGSKQ